jgi:hypothetical protein
VDTELPDFVARFSYLQNNETAKEKVSVAGARSPASMWWHWWMKLYFAAFRLSCPCHCIRVFYRYRAFAMGGWF